MKTMAVRVLLMTVFCSVPSLSANMSGHVDGGKFSHIWQFPHSVQIVIMCGGKTYSCGSSIVNQAILMTAAHCLECYRAEVISFAGTEREMDGLITGVSRIQVHKNFDLVTGANDIALLRLNKELKFDINIRRVVLMRRPPYDELAFVAGWGRVWPFGPGSVYLKHISQVVYKREECYKIGINEVPLGAICGEHKYKVGKPESGDSGSAMILPTKQIQIGIVSYTIPKISMTNTVYTDTGFFFDWIKENAEMLYCENKTLANST